MNENIQYAVLEQLERIADGLEALGSNSTLIVDRLEPMVSQKTEAEEAKDDLIEVPLQPSTQQQLSLFFESLPTWLYNDLRRKIIPTHLAAKLIGMPQNQLQKLAEIGMIKSSSGRYDLVELMGYLEDTFSSYDHYLPPAITTTIRQ